MAMERIQTAISKAREARRSQGDHGEPASLRDPLPLVPPSAAALAASLAPPLASDAADAAWAGLTEFQPKAGHLERSRVIAQAGGPAAAPFDGLRTRLLYMMRDKGWKRIAVTSPGPGCGKSTVALNLALSLSRLADLRTVLIDVDMRRPALARLLGVTAPLQVANSLAGKAKLEENLLRIGPNLVVGTNARPGTHTAELLHSPVAAEALDRLEKLLRPDVMIFDLPPMQVSDDTMAALALVDCALVIAGAEKTTVTEIDRCERDVASRTNVAGVILNKARYLEKGDAYGYGYGYY